LAPPAGNRIRALPSPLAGALRAGQPPGRSTGPRHGLAAACALGAHGPQPGIGRLPMTTLSCCPHTLREPQSYRRRTTANRPVMLAPLTASFLVRRVDSGPIDGKFLPSPPPGQPSGAVSRASRPCARAGRHARLAPGAGTGGQCSGPGWTGVGPRRGPGVPSRQRSAILLPAGRDPVRRVSRVLFPLSGMEPWSPVLSWNRRTELDVW